MGTGKIGDGSAGPAGGQTFRLWHTSWGFPHQGSLGDGDGPAYWTLVAHGFSPDRRRAWACPWEPSLRKALSLDTPVWIGEEPRSW